MLSVSAVSKHFGATVAVQDLSFTLQRGEVVGLLGRNGAGKTTLLRMLAGDLAPSAGEVLLDGLALGRHPAARSLLGYLPEVPPIYPEQSPREFLHYLGGLRGLRGRRLAQRVRECLDQFQLGDVANRPCGALSLGYRKRLGLAQAAVHSPPYLLLDEPISGLDPAQIVEIRGQIRDMAQTQGVLLSSHILSEIHQTCDRILLLHRGRVVAQGSEAALSEQAGAGAHRTLLELRAGRSATLRWLEEQQAAGTLGAFELQGEAAPGVQRVQVQAGHEARERLARAAVAAGYGLRRRQPLDGELEGVFLALTRAEAAAPSEGAP